MYTMKPSRSFYSGSHMHAHHHAGAPMPMHGYHPHAGHGFCHSCCHPRTKCCCVRRDCRKEAKELLVESTVALGDKGAVATHNIEHHIQIMTPVLATITEPLAEEAVEETGTPATTIGRLVGSRQKAKAGLGKAFIGGGCCVHLSIEYAPTKAAGPHAVAVMVVDSDNTALIWVKLAQADDGYQIKEGIIATKPGAHVTMLVVNMTARLRWCEIFSC